MDPLQRYLVTLVWGPDLLVSSLEGSAEGVLGRPASELVGRPLAEVLSMSAAEAHEFHLRVAPGGVVEHLITCARGVHPVCLRATSLLLEGDLRAASVLNLTALLDGAPLLPTSWLAQVSHTIRSPVSSVKMAVMTLARNPDLSDRDKRRLAFAKMMLRETDRMLWFLFEYGRDTPPATEPTSVRALLQEAASMVEEELAERQVELAFQEEDRDLPAVKADPGRLRPALSQLLLDVAQGLDPGSRLRITLRRSAKGAQAVFRDPSSAVLPEERRTLYEPFGSRLARSNGLSLAVLRLLMLSHGGQFVAEGDGSQGTLYTLTFVV